ncbi:potassium channel family protein [Curtanaerobium respiraculi]|uniref:potassium channel family protein n=1 Tax=Curtanaerobium respiraculi TaxID=2949669 RepID=UPI0024B3502A|nr:TrkA family potassium uptake protein [Curtanaerobium respiraculi]
MFGKERVIVIGCGFLGSTLASAISRQRFAVVVVDMKEASFDQLDQDYDGETFSGDGSHPSVLREAGIQQARYVIAATGSDTTNFLIAELSSEIFGVERVFARIESHALAQMLEDLGVSVICPHLVCSRVVYSLMGLGSQGDE